MAKTLLRRVQELLAARPDVDRQAFGRAIGRSTPSWLSEFFGSKRTTNDLRLVIRIAKFFGVSVGFLLNESDRQMDAETATLLAAWQSMDDDRDRQAVLNLALMLKGRNGDPGAEPPPELPPAHGAGGGTTKAPKKRR